MSDVRKIAWILFFVYLSATSNAEVPHVAPHPRLKRAASLCPKPALRIDDENLKLLLQNYTECFENRAEAEAFFVKLSWHGLIDLRKRLLKYEGKTSIELPELDLDLGFLKSSEGPKSQLHINSLRDPSEAKLFSYLDLKERKERIEASIRDGNIDPSLLDLWREELRLIAKWLPIAEERDAKTAKSPWSAEQLKFIRELPNLSEEERRAWVSKYSENDLWAFYGKLEREDLPHVQRDIPSGFDRDGWVQSQIAASEYLKTVLEDPLWYGPFRLKALRDDTEFKRMSADWYFYDDTHSKWLQRYVENDRLLRGRNNHGRLNELLAEQKILLELLTESGSRVPLATEQLPATPARDLVQLAYRDPHGFVQKVNQLPIEERQDLIRDLRLFRKWNERNTDGQWVRRYVDHALSLAEPSVQATVDDWTKEKLVAQKRAEEEKIAREVSDRCRKTVPPTEAVASAHAAWNAGQARMRATDERLRGLRTESLPFAPKRNRGELATTLTPDLKEFGERLGHSSAAKIRAFIRELKEPASFKFDVRSHLRLAEGALTYHTRLFVDGRSLLKGEKLELWAYAIPSKERAPLADFLYFLVADAKRFEAFGCPTEGVSLLQNARRTLLILEGGFPHDERRFVDAIWRMNEEGLQALIEGTEILLPGKKSDHSDRLHLIPLLMHLEEVRVQLHKVSGLPDDDIDRPLRIAGSHLAGLIQPILESIRVAIRAGDGAKLGEIRKKLTETGLWHYLLGMVRDELPVGPIVGNKLRELVVPYVEEFNVMSTLLAEGRAKPILYEKNTVVIQTSAGPVVHSLPEYKKKVDAEFEIFRKMLELYGQRSAKGSNVAYLFYEHFAKAFNFTNDFKGDLTKAKDHVSKMLHESIDRMRELGVDEKTTQAAYRASFLALDEDTKRLEEASKLAPYFAVALGAAVLAIPFASIPMTAAGLAARIVVPALIGGVIGGGINYAEQKAQIAGGVHGRREIDKLEILKHAAIGAGTGIVIANTGQVGIVGARLLAIYALHDAAGDAVGHWNEGRKEEALVDTGKAALSVWAIRGKFGGKPPAPSAKRAPEVEVTPGTPPTTAHHPTGGGASPKEGGGVSSKVGLTTDGKAVRVSIEEPAPYSPASEPPAASLGYRFLTKAEADFLGIKGYKLKGDKTDVSTRELVPSEMLQLAKFNRTASGSGSASKSGTAPKAPLWQTGQQAILVGPTSTSIEELNKLLAENSVLKGPTAQQIKKLEEQKARDAITDRDWLKHNVQGPSILPGPTSKQINDFQKRKERDSILDVDWLKHQIKLPSIVHSTPVTFDERDVEKKILDAVKPITEDEIKALIKERSDGIGTESDYLQLLALSTQWASPEAQLQLIKQLQRLNKSVVLANPINAGELVIYFKGKAGEILLPANPMWELSMIPDLSDLDRRGSVLIVDSVLLSQMESNPALAKRIFESDLEFVYPQGMDRANVFNASAIRDPHSPISKQLASDLRARGARPPPKFDSLLNEPVLSRLDRLWEGAGKPGVKPRSRIHILTNPALPVTSSPAELAKHLRVPLPTIQAIKAHANATGEPEMAYEIMTRFLEYFSPEKLREGSKEIHQRVLQTARDNGIPEENIYFAIPSRGHSFSLVTATYADVNGIPLKQIDTLGELRRKGLPNKKLIVILDDFAPSGTTMKDSIEAARDIFSRPETIIVGAPVLVTADAVKAVERRRFPNSVFLGPAPGFKFPISVEHVTDSDWYKGLTPELKAKADKVIGAKGYGVGYTLLISWWMSPDNNMRGLERFVKEFLFSPNAYKD